MGNARLSAVRALIAVYAQGGYSNLVLDNILEKEDLTAQDRSFCATLFYTTVQRTITLDHAIASCSNTPVKKLSPVVLNSLRTGFCQLLFLPSVPHSAACNETVAVVKALDEARAAGFVNAVLRGFVRRNLAYPQPKDALTALSVQYSVPMPLIQLWRKSYGHEQAVAILEGLEQPPPLFLRTNTLRTTPAALAARLADEGISAVPVDHTAGALAADGFAGGIARSAAFREGLFHVQDLSSQQCVAAAFADGFSPARILDVCAAPGGKSFTAAQLAGSSAVVVASDLYASRTALVTEGAARLGLGNIRTRVADAAVPNEQLGCFDLVLCDVVCSGFGIIRRKPEIRYKGLETLDALPELQYNILNTSARYCRQGSRLVYSTCTLNPAENEQVAARFLTANPLFRPLGQATTILPLAGGGDGFFYTVMERAE